MIPEHLNTFLSGLLLVLSSESLHFTQPRSFALNHSTGMWHWRNSFSYSLLKKLLGILWKCTKCWPANSVFFCLFLLKIFFPSCNVSQTLQEMRNNNSPFMSGCITSAAMRASKGRHQHPSCFEEKKKGKKTLNQVLPAGLTILM